MKHNLFNSLQSFPLGNGQQAEFYSLPALEKAGVGSISRLPVSIRIVLESVLRNCDGKKVSEANVRSLANWSAKHRAPKKFHSSSPASCCRISRACRCWSTWQPCAQLRLAWAKIRKLSNRWSRSIWSSITPCRSISLVHRALRLNMQMEFKRNRERYQFLKWGTQAFDSFKVVPPVLGSFTR